MSNINAKFLKLVEGVPHLLSLGGAAVFIQASPAAIIEAAARLNVEPKLALDDSVYFTIDDVERIRDELAERAAARTNRAKPAEAN